MADKKGGNYDGNRCIFDSVILRRNGEKEVAGFTVPAINLRGITYYSALPATLRSRVRLTLAMTRFMTCFEIVNIKPISNQKIA